MNSPQTFRGYISRAVMLVAAVTVTVGCGASADSPEVKLERARILMQRDQAAEAIPLLNEVIDATPKDPEARYQRGVAYESLSVLEKALIDYTECLTLNPERTDALNNKAVVLAKMKRFEDAAAEFTRLVDLDPQGPLAYRNRGLCHFDLGRFDDALADYAKALELAPTDPANWFQRAGVYLKQNRFDEAEQDYSKAIELDPALASAWMNRGVARFKRGDKKLAAADLQKAQSLDDNIVIPDIDFFSTESGPIATEPSSSLLWQRVRRAAEMELSTRGLTSITVAREFPSFLCAEFTGQSEDGPVKILVACLSDDESSFNLPANWNTTNDGVAKPTLLLVKAPGIDGPIEAVRFQKSWNPKAIDANPLMLRYRMDAAAPP